MTASLAEVVSREVTSFSDARLERALRPLLPRGLAAEAVDQAVCTASRELAEVYVRWPHAPALDRGFDRALQQRLAAARDLARVLPRLRAGDLFLAWWALAEPSRGIAAFWDAFRDDVARVLGRFAALDRDELWQIVQLRLFVGGEREAGLATYSGLGFLQNWLRVLVTRACLDAARSALRQRTSDLDSAGHSEDAPLLALVVPPRAATSDGARLHQAIREGFGRALATLEPRQRTFLRMATIDGLSLEQLAATFRVSRATAARVLAAGRAALRDATRREVRGELEVGDDTLRSLLRDLETQLDLSLARILAEDAPSGGADETVALGRRPEGA